MPECALWVELIQHTPIPEQVVALGARLCYSDASIPELQDRIQKKDQNAFIQGIVENGHHSILEHAVFVFGIEGVSRILLAQITRHRIASYSVQSQRYVSKANGFGYIVPPSIRGLGQEAMEKYARQMETMHVWYQEWQDDLGGASVESNQDARFVLPNACETRFIVTMNARELLHFFSLRCCNRAQWEIRALANEMLSKVYSVAPALFETAGPPCVAGRCTEGKRSCGHTEEVRQHNTKIKNAR